LGEEGLGYSVSSPRIVLRPLLVDVDQVAEISISFLFMKTGYVHFTGQSLNDEKKSKR